MKIILVFFNILFLFCKPEIHFNSSQCYSCHIKSKLELEGKILSKFSNAVHSHKRDKKWESSNQCKNCHKKEFDEWSFSMHKKSYSNFFFKEALKEEPRLWCLNCHAPFHELKEISNLKEDENLSEGIGCTICHVKDGEIFGKRNRIDLKEHKVLEDKSLKNGELCKNCHEFNFTETHEPSIRYSNFPMQTTFSEFKEFQNVHKKDSCNSCHLKNSLHDFSGPNDKIFLKKNVLMDFNLIKENENYILKVKIKIPKIGHAFPTGDLFRSVNILIWNQEKKLLEEYKIRKLIRMIDKELILDTRLFPNKNGGIEKELIFTFKEKPSFCELSYHYQDRIEEKFSSKANLKTILYSGSCN